MGKHKHNPYEIPIMNPEKPLRILFLTDSLEKEIRSSNPIISKLHKLSEFDELEIWFSPTQAPDLQKLTSNIVTSNNCEYTLIKGNYPHKRFIASLHMNCGERQYSTLLREFPDSKSSPNLFETVKGSRINNMELDIIYRIDDAFYNWDLLDLVVAHKDDLETASLAGKFHVVCLDDVMERIRLFMLNYRLFYVEKWFNTCEISYYAHRRLKLFPNMKQLWSIINTHVENSEWVQSLYTRTELYLRAIDKLKINSLRQPNNIVATQYEYDFAFLILLVTGIFDNLAWLICKIYEIELGKMDIKLIIPNEEKKRKFIKAVEEKCSCLSDFLSMELTQAKIGLVYPIRDTVVHRDYLTTVRYMDVQKKIDAVYLKVSPEISQKFGKLTDLGMNLSHCFQHDKIGKSTVTDKATGKTDIYGASEDMYIIPYAFIDMIDDMVSGLINSMTDIIVTSKNGSIASDSSTGIFEFFGKEVDPLYF